MTSVPCTICTHSSPCRPFTPSIPTILLILSDFQLKTTMPEAPIESLPAVLAAIAVQDEKNKMHLQFIEDVTNNTDQVQVNVLAEILKTNGQVEYLTRHGLDGRTDRDSFKKLVPVVTYEDLKHYINRLANGEKSPILCAQPISEFLSSSGTSGGERKLMPTNKEDMDRRWFLYSLLMPLICLNRPGIENGKGMYLLFIKSESKTPGGLPARSVLTSYYNSRQFKERAHDPYEYTSPNETILCCDYYQSMYSQLLCGLLGYTEVLRVGSVFAYGFILAIKFLEKNWADLCKDIRTGILDARITDPAVREAVMKILTPNPVLAEVIDRECSKDSWKGIITRLWPNTKYIDVIVTGSMAQYIPTLDYYSNGLPLVCSMYASSECYFGVNLNPFCKHSEVAYTIIPSMGYFEFLPVHRNHGVSDLLSLPSDTQEQQQLVDLVDVELGKEYELVVTTYGGLYRYKVGDVLRVAGFKNKAPQFNFVCRKNVVLSIDADKTDEVELQSAVTTAAERLQPYGAALAEYTSYADSSTFPGHYLIYWELRLGPAVVPKSVFENCCLDMEESLNSVYRQGRVAESIGPLEIKLVEAGTFDKLMEYALSHDATINQYKTPRCVKIAPIVELLNFRAVGSYRSPSCPKWAPGHKQWNCNN